MSTPPRLIASAEEYRGLVGTLRREPILAVDTEAASFHRHANRIYLLQVSTRTETAVIDPMAVSDLTAFGEVLADPGIEVVFHDADYDLRLLHHQYGFQVRRLFDTRVAAEFVGEPGLSLAALLTAHFGVKVDKRFQRADWSARPLSGDMLAYAAGDTQHLVELRDILKQKLEDMGRLGWAEEEFGLLEGVRWNAGKDREPAYLRIKSAKALSLRQLAILREVHRWRVGVAVKLDRAEFRVLSNEALLDISKTAPTSDEALARIKGVGPDTVRRRGSAILAAVARGLALPEDDLPKPPRPAKRVRQPDVEARIARLKTARGAVTKRIGLAPGVIFPNSLLEAVAKSGPKDLPALAGVDGVRTWQVETFGVDLLEAVNGS